MSVYFVVKLFCDDCQKEIEILISKQDSEGFKQLISFNKEDIIKEVNNVFDWDTDFEVTLCNDCK